MNINASVEERGEIASKRVSLCIGGPMANYAIDKAAGCGIVGLLMVCLLGLYG